MVGTVGGHYNRGDDGAGGKSGVLSGRRRRKSADGAWNLLSDRSGCICGVFDVYICVCQG